MAPADDATERVHGDSFEVCVQGELSDALIEELGGIRRPPTTTVVVQTVDRAHLHSVIRRVEDLGLKLISIHELSGDADPTVGSGD